MILEIEDARETLRIDNKHNDDIIKPLVEAIPDYIEIKTGYQWQEESDDQLAKAAARFILQLWYYPQTQDVARINRTIDSLLYALAAKRGGM